MYHRNSNYGTVVNLIPKENRVRNRGGGRSLPPFLLLVLCLRAWFPLRGLIDRALPFPWFMLHANYAHLHEDRSSSLQLDPPRRLTRACPPIGRDNPRDRDLLSPLLLSCPSRAFPSLSVHLVNLFGWKFIINLL